MYTLVILKRHGVIELLAAEGAARNPICRLFSADIFNFWWEHLQPVWVNKCRLNFSLFCKGFPSLLQSSQWQRSTTPVVFPSLVHTCSWSTWSCNSLPSLKVFPQTCLLDSSVSHMHLLPPSLTPKEFLSPNTMEPCTNGLATGLDGDSWGVVNGDCVELCIAGCCPAYIGVWRAYGDIGGWENPEKCRWSISTWFFSSETSLAETSHPAQWQSQMAWLALMWLSSSLESGNVCPQFCQRQT